MTTPLILWIMVGLRVFGALKQARNPEGPVKIDGTRLVLVVAFDACYVGLSITTGYAQFGYMVAAAWAIAIVAGLAKAGSKS